MTQIRVRTPLSALSLALLSWTASAAEPAPFFRGPYVALEASRQNTIAGALVGGVDTLAQKARSVASLAGGYRHQFAGGFVAGLEASFGVTDGDLRHSDTAAGLTIDYANSTQYGLGGSIGYAFGATRATLIYGYLAETKRSFDVTIRGPLGTGTQSDKQGLLRYGLGVERRLGDQIGLRASVGSSRAKFSNRTNFDPRSKIDFALGIVWQF